MSTASSPPDRRRLMHEHAGSLHDLLKHLHEGFPCSSIMTPWDQVRCVDGQEDGPPAQGMARSLMEANEFSAVPLVTDRRVYGMYRRDDPRGAIVFEDAHPEQFFTADNDVISLLFEMKERSRFAALLGAESDPIGLVTYADFSKRPARVILFALVSEVEYFLARAIDEVYPDDTWVDLIEPLDDEERHPRDVLLERKRVAKSWDTTMPLTSFAEVGHLARVVEGSNAVRELLSEDDRFPRRLKSLPDLRNRVAHAVKPIVAGPRLVKSVAGQVALMLKWIERWEQQWARRAAEVANATAG